MSVILRTVLCMAGEPLLLKESAIITRAARSAVKIELRVRASGVPTGYAT